MGTRGLVLYLLSGFSVAVLSVLFFSDVNDYKLYQNNLSSSNSTLLHSSAYGSSTDTTWPVCLSKSVSLYKFLCEGIVTICLLGFEFLDAGIRV